MGDIFEIKKAIDNKEIRVGIDNEDRIYLKDQEGNKVIIKQITVGDALFLLARWNKQNEEMKDMLKTEEPDRKQRRA